MKSLINGLTVVVVFIVVGAVYGADAAPSPADPVASVTAERNAFLSGYIASVLDRELKFGVESVAVVEGAVTVKAPALVPADREQIIRVLSAIDGVISVQILPAPEPQTEVEQPPLLPIIMLPTHTINTPAPGGALKDGWLPGGKLFDPLLADPRWPHMGVSYQEYANHDLGQSIAAVSIGDSVALYRDDLGSDGQWELGVQGAVFAIFDLAANSEDLLNADYLVAGAWSWKRQNDSVMLRVLHQSSHVGDEFLIANPGFTRVNYSFEAIDAIVSHHFKDRTIRAYAGGRVLVNVDPSSLDRWSGQYGIELQCSQTFINGWVRPIAAVDVQHHEENDWEADVSTRAGVEIKDPDNGGHALQVLAEYYNGHSPNGQFYADRVRFVGMGIHFYY